MHSAMHVAMRRTKGPAVKLSATVFPTFPLTPAKTGVQSPDRAV
jgi:hypothetical protein